MNLKLNKKEQDLLIQILDKTIDELDMNDYLEAPEETEIIHNLYNVLKG